MSKDKDAEQRLWLSLGYGGKRADPRTWRYWKKPGGAKQWVIAAPNDLAEFEQHDKTVFYQGKQILEAATQWSATWRTLAYFYEHVIPPLTLDGPHCLPRLRTVCTRNDLRPNHSIELTCSSVLHPPKPDKPEPNRGYD